MKPLHKTSKPLSFFIVILLLFQSCSVYKKKPIDLEQAAKNGNKVKVTMVDKRKIPLKKIELQDSTYTGITHTKKGMVKISLDPNKIQRIQEIDKPVSIAVTILAIVVPVGLAVVVISALGASSSWSETGNSSQ